MKYPDGKNGLTGLASNGYGGNADLLFEIVFEKGIARYMDKKLWINGELVAEDEATGPEKAYWGRGHEWLIKEYYENGSYFSAVDVRNTMNAVFSMYDSAKADGRECICKKR